MTELTQPGQSPNEYADILHDLRHVSRTMLLAFRIQVGRLLLQRFYSGRIEVYRDQSPNKESSFTQFARDCRQDLSDMGLSTQLLRDCINAHATYEALPAAVRDQLLFTHVVELGRVDDPTARARLAVDATQQQWRISQLKEAVALARSGRYYDTDPTTPGTQPPPPAPPKPRAAQAGRLVTELERTGQQLDAWRAAWQTVDTTKLGELHRDRMAEAVRGLKTRIAELERVLALSSRGRKRRG